MQQVFLSTTDHDRLWFHLLQGEEEEAAFIFTKTDVLTPFHMLLVSPEGFAYKSRFGFELTDAYRASIIKKAHDLDAMIIEFHSHPFPSTACFSPTDIEGLRDFVPHVRWRLKNKPYAAVVVAPQSFDALFWATDGAPEPIALNVGGRIVLPTRKSLEEWSYA
jgi:hypothetical protein